MKSENEICNHKFLVRDKGLLCENCAGWFPHATATIKEDCSIYNRLLFLKEFLNGAHLATPDENARTVMHMACKKIDDIIKEL